MAYNVSDIRLTEKAAELLASAAQEGKGAKEFLNSVVLIKYFDNGTKYNVPVAAGNEETIKLATVRTNYKKFITIKDVRNENAQDSKFTDLIDGLGFIIKKKNDAKPQ